MNLDERLKYAEMKARHSHMLLPWYRKWWGIVIIAISALIILDIVVTTIQEFKVVKDLSKVKAEKTIEEQRAIRLKAIKGLGDNYDYGTSSPQVTITEFADFACPYSHDSAAGMRKVVEEFKNKVKVIYRDYPLHANSLDLAIAARCAGEQNQFWKMHDVLYANQDRLSSSTAPIKDNLNSIASEIQLNTAQFSACLDSQKYLEQIKNDFNDAETLAIKGTPTWFINNYELTGHIPEEKFRELITGLIK